MVPTLSTVGIARERFPAVLTAVIALLILLCPAVSCAMNTLPLIQSPISLVLITACVLTSIASILVVLRVIYQKWCRKAEWAPTPHIFNSHALVSIVIIVSLIVTAMSFWIQSTHGVPKYTGGCIFSTVMLLMLLGLTIAGRKTRNWLQAAAMLFGALGSIAVSLTFGWAARQYPLLFVLVLFVALLKIAELSVYPRQRAYHHEKSE